MLNQPRNNLEVPQSTTNSGFFKEPAANDTGSEHSSENTNVEHEVNKHFHSNLGWHPVFSYQGPDRQSRLRVPYS